MWNRKTNVYNCDLLYNCLHDTQTLQKTVAVFHWSCQSLARVLRDKPSFTPFQSKQTKANTRNAAFRSLDDCVFQLASPAHFAAVTVKFVLI